MVHYLLKCFVYHLVERFAKVVRDVCRYRSEYMIYFTFEYFVEKGLLGLTIWEVLDTFCCGLNFL